MRMVMTATNFNGVDDFHDLDNSQVVPYTECGLGMEAQPFTSSVLAPKLFIEKVCSQGKKVRW